MLACRLCIALSVVASRTTILTNAYSGLVAPVDRRTAIESSIIIATTNTASAPSNNERAVSAPKVTNKVAFDVRISRQDGTFYVRDDLPDEPQNKVFQGKIVLGLYGEAAPNHVEKFLRFVDSTDGGPAYSRSLFTKFDEVTGLVTAGYIPSLEVTELQGSVALRYGERILAAPLWIEPSNLPHSSQGLLTHSNLDVTPAFGITTYDDSSALNPTHTVFGKILEDEGQFLQQVQALPTYAMERPQTSSLDNANIVDDAAATVFNAQRGFFLNAAKTFGDSRAGKVYPGKFLRRVEVTRVERLR